MEHHCRLRAVDLGSRSRGALFLSEMPGRYAPLASYEAAWRACGITRIVCLAQLETEVLPKSPEYALKLQRRRLGPQARYFPIPNCGVPAEIDAFAALIRDIICWLQHDEFVLLHCGAGIGRTGTVAACVLIALGYAPYEALRRVEEAGSHPEVYAQRAFITTFAAYWKQYPSVPESTELSSDDHVVPAHRPASRLGQIFARVSPRRLARLIATEHASAYQRRKQSASVSQH